MYNTGKAEIVVRRIRHICTMDLSLSGLQQGFIGLLLVQVLADTWYNSTDSNGYRRRTHATQFHNLIGFSLGPAGTVLGKLSIAISVFGTAIAQIVASSSSAYTLYTFYNKL